MALINAYSAYASGTVFEKELSKKIHNIKVDVENVREEFDALNTNDNMVKAESWSIDSRWKWFKILSQNFEVLSKWPIRDVKYWTNGKCRWTRRENITEYCVQGRVKGKCNRGLHAKVTVEVFKSDKYGDDLSVLQQTLTSKQDMLVEMEEQLDKSEQKHTQLNHEIDMLREDIESRKDEITKLSSDYPTMAECLERFSLESSK